MPWKPRFPGERPTLGWHVLEWVPAMLLRPDSTQDPQPLVFTREQAEFILRFYELDPTTGRRIVKRGVMSRPRGWGKSPFSAALAIVEALADVVPDGWDAAGRPVGKPWAEVRTPLVQIAAVSETQVMTNTWSSVLEMMDDDAPVHDEYPGIEPLGTMINLPVGKMLPITASGNTVKGARTVFAVWDQTEEWLPSNGGHNLRRTMADNAAKVGGSYIETPNAFTPGLRSVAEESHEAWVAQLEGRARVDGSVLFDHREAPGDTDMTDRESLLAGLRYAYGDSSGDPRGCVIHEPPCAPGWADHEDHIARIWQHDADPAGSRGNFLNQITHASDSWLDQPTWAAQTSDARLQDGDEVVLGFDGSRGRARGKPDATALVAVRMRDGHAQTLLVDEAGEHPKEWEGWEPNLARIEAVLADAFDRYKVVAFYCDPARDWRSHVNLWESRWGKKVRKRAKADHPFEWWMVGGNARKVEEAVNATEAALRLGHLTHDGNPTLTAHALNARRRITRGHLSLAKDSAESSRKIDAAVALVIAWQARLDALGAGVTQTEKKPPKKYKVRRIR